MSTSVLDQKEREEDRLIQRWLHGTDFVVVGKSVERVDGLEKVLGKSKYMEDYFSTDIYFARLVKSDVSSAALKGVDFKRAATVPGFVDGISAKDVPGQNQVGYYLLDQPAFADDVIRFNGEPIGLTVAKTPEAAEESAGLVKLRYIKKPAIYDPFESMSSPLLVHEEKKSNIAVTTKVRKGDIETGLKESSIIVENTYRTAYQDHAYIEPEGAIAIPTSEGMTVVSCNQYPHLAQKTIARVLGCQQREVRTVQAVIGGAFGGKDDMGPIVGAQAAVAARKLGRPVMLLYSREDSLTSHCKRDPAIVRYKMGAAEDGTLKAIDVDIIFEAGAYANRGPFTLWRGTMHASGPYIVPHARVDGKLVYTNKVYQGSFRGFGNPPVQLAAESNLDEVADRLGMDPVDIRMKNLLREKSITVTGQVITDPVGVAETLSKVASGSSWYAKRKAFGKPSKNIARGIGVACSWHGISTSKGGPDWSSGYIIIRRDGSVDAYSGIVEIGQGTTTAITQVVAEALGIGVDAVTVYMGTTDAPDTGATHASRGSSVGTMGMLVAASQLRMRLNGMASKMLGCTEENLVIENGVAFDKRFQERKIDWSVLVNECYSHGVEMASTGYFFVPKGKFDEEKGSGDAYPAFSYMTVVVEVEVDLSTGMVFVKRVWPGIAAGRVLNPGLVEAQVHGAVAQGLGYAIMEEVQTVDGRVVNQNFTDYLIPTVRDMPEVMPLEAVEDVYTYGPFGAKGVGEMALIPMAPAIANAVRHAIGERPLELPMTPERIRNLLGTGEAK